MKVIKNPALAGLMAVSSICTTTRPRLAEIEEELDDEALYNIISILHLNKTVVNI